jgi:hypothetical protein
MIIDVSTFAFSGLNTLGKSLMMFYSDSYLLAGVGAIDLSDGLSFLSFIFKIGRK